MIPINKGIHPKLPSNYRPIFFLPILSQVFEKLLSSQIRGYLDETNYISPRQFGFRPRASPLDRPISSADNEQNSPQYDWTGHSIHNTCFAATDIKKAFDSVNHQLLVRQLEQNFNFQKSSLQLVYDYLKNQEQTMKTNWNYPNITQFLVEFHKDQYFVRCYLLPSLMTGFRLARNNFKYALNAFGVKQLNNFPPHISQCHAIKSFKRYIRSHFLNIEALK